ncbi:hypothetical protein SLEP1_g3689 [Rubroshorea leprosula]|uniref:Uncharacterized protein n=1 Tax=Rubroshorea leprosula TaxID=152421 RepID=A0AAV5HUY3_9ROSI|nr:hypothetical protein SLEP1_g3689 [Rubroshorea leprosula]
MKTCCAEEGDFSDSAIVASVGKAIAAVEADVVAGINLNVSSASSFMPLPSTVAHSASAPAVEPLSVVIDTPSSGFDYFDIFRFPRVSDGRFLVKGAFHHVEREPVVPSFPTEVPTIFPFLSKDEKAGLALGSARVFSSVDKHPMGRAAFQCLPPDMCVYKDQFACGLRFPPHPFITEICDAFSLSLPQLAPRAVAYIVAFIMRCFFAEDHSYSEAVYRFLMEPSMSITESITQKNLIDSGVWVPGFCGPDFPVPSVPPGFKASSKPEYPLKRKTGKASTVAVSEPLLATAGGVDTLAALSRSAKIEKLEKVEKIGKLAVAEKIEKTASKSRGSVPQGAPLVRRSKRLRSSPVKVAANSSFSKGIVVKDMMDGGEKTSSALVLSDDELQSFSSEEKALLLSITDFVAGKSFSKSLPGLPLKNVVRPRYDVCADGPSVIGHNSVARELSESQLLNGDKKLLSNFPLEVLHDMAVHGAVSVCTLLQYMKGLVLESEDSSYRAEADLAEMRSRSKDLINLCRKLISDKISVDKRVALESSLVEVERLKKELSMLQECYDLLKKEKELISSSASVEKAPLTSANASLMSANASLLQHLDEQVLRNSVLENSVSDLQAQVSSLRVSVPSTIQTFKESSEGRAFAFSDGLGYFNIAIKLVKVLLPRRGMILPDCLAEFEKMDVAALICADLELKRIYDQGSEYVSLGASPSGVEEGSGSSWDFEDSAGAMHSGNNSTDVAGASPSPGN